MREAQLPSASAAVFESYSLSGGTAARRVTTSDGRTHVSSVSVTSPALPGEDPASLYDAAWLRLPSPPALHGARGEVRIVDVFSGCGAMSLGAAEACRALALRPRPVLAVDLNRDALAVYRDNFPDAATRACSVTDLVSGSSRAALTDAERALRDACGRVDLLVGGPPCQGHSNLNNHTRRSDPRNALLFRMARFAEVLQPAHVIIENVRDVRLDRGRVVERAVAALTDAGYTVDGGIVRGIGLGVAQTRQRFFLVASRRVRPSIAEWTTALARPPRTLSWAIRDLVGVESTAAFDSPSTPSAENARRIAYLFRHDLYDLPNAQRPLCHRRGAHTYWAVYGRLRWDRPAPTLTTGFGSTGQGRNVHPERPRTLTPHEAARIQFFPDFFRFGGLRRTALATLIGNAVPPKMVYAVALNLLAGG